MAAEHSTHRYVPLVDRTGLEDGRQIITPFVELFVEDINSAQQFRPLLRFQIVSADINGVNSVTDTVRYVFTMNQWG